jgi:hypothetical protein
LKDAVSAFEISADVLADGAASAPAVHARVEPARRLAAG